jgi:glutathione S-transferase
MEKYRSSGEPASVSSSRMKLYRLNYSPYALKVQMLLDLLGAKYELVDVEYGDRSELAKVTGGYIYVPVLVDDDGSVVTESRRICERLLERPGGERLVPKPFEGPIWAYADYCDGPLEDVLFRISTPVVREKWQDPFERALYVLIKERKFGTGCVDAWANDRENLVARGRHLLAPTISTLSQQPFLFGERPTLADCALYGNLTMLHAADPALVSLVAEPLAAYRTRVETFAKGSAR